MDEGKVAEGSPGGAVGMFFFFIFRCCIYNLDFSKELNIS